MTDFFDYIRKSLSEKGIASIYPSFLREIDSYENYFSNHSLLTAVHIREGEQFQAIINWNNSKLYSLEWDISRLLSDLDQYPLQRHKISLSNTLVYSDKSNTVSNTVNSYALRIKEKEIDPILLVWIDFINKYVVIDGNHRYAASQQSNKERIEAIVLPAGIHLKYMLSEESQMRYMIFHNIHIMCNINHHLRCTLSEEIDDSDSLYPIGDSEIRISPIRNIFICFLYHISSLKIIEKIRTTLKKLPLI